MSLIVETGTIVEDAESYASVAFADSYNTAYLSNAAWTALSTANKEIALRKATQYLDSVYGNLWVGRRVSALQELDWPRQGIWDTGEIPHTEIPVLLQRATAEIAVRSLSTTLLPDIDEGEYGLKSEYVKVGPISVREERKESVTSTRPRFPNVDLMLRRLIFARGVVERG